MSANSGRFRRGGFGYFWNSGYMGRFALRTQKAVAERLFDARNHFLKHRALLRPGLLLDRSRYFLVYLGHVMGLVLVNGNFHF